MLAKPHFRFKQFSVWHDQCAMKVSTDGILLGAWASISNTTKKVLDIGTGTGLLSLMVSQRLQEHLQSDMSATDINVTAVELDPLAANQALFNFAQSYWSDSLSVINDDIRSWNEQAKDKFDLIVCNPPYFSDSLMGENSARNKARHNDSLPFRDLLTVVKSRLNKDGTFELILPCDEAESFLTLATEFAFKTQALAYVKTTPNKAPSRTLIRLGFKTSTSENIDIDVDVDEIIIRNECGEYSAKFTNLCRAFYLKMPD